MEPTTDESGSGVQQPVIITQPNSLDFVMKVIAGCMVSIAVMVGLLVLAAGVGTGMYLQKTLELGDDLRRIESAQDAARLRAERILRGQIVIRERLRLYEPEKGDNDEEVPDATP